MSAMSQHPAEPLFVPLATAFQRCLESPAYRALAERPAQGGSLERRQAGMLAAALCDAGHDELRALRLGVELLWSIHLERRNARIVAAFTGDNYGVLARQFKLSTRQIRRIVAAGEKDSDINPPNVTNRGRQSRP